MNERNYNSRTSSVVIWAPFALCMFYAVLDIVLGLFYERTFPKSTIFSSIAFPMFLVGLVCIAFRTKLNEQETRIRELEKQIETSNKEGELSSP